MTTTEHDCGHKKAEIVRLLYLQLNKLLKPFCKGENDFVNNIVNDFVKPFCKGENDFVSDFVNDFVKPFCKGENDFVNDFVNNFVNDFVNTKVMLMLRPWQLNLTDNAMKLIDKLIEKDVELFLLRLISSKLILSKRPILSKPFLKHQISQNALVKL